MKNFVEYILEYQGIALHNARKSIGSPDGITHDYKEGQYEANYDGEGGDPYAFIYNKKTNKILFSESGYTHHDIFNDYKGTKKGNEVGLDILDNTKQLRYTGSFYDKYDWKTGEVTKSAKDEMKEWFEKNKEVLKVLCSGRIWYIDNIGFEIKRYDEDWTEENEDKLKNYPSYKDHKNLHGYIAFWNDIPTGKFKEYCDNIVKLFNETHDKDHKIEEYVAVGNNGEPLFSNINDKSPIKTKQRTKQREKEIEKDFDNHNPEYGESQEEFRKRKRKNTEEFRKNRDEKNQQVYNHTKSHTEAEYRSLKYQESLKDFVNRLDEEKLSDVKSDWSPKEGLFKEKDPYKIVKYLLDNSEDEGQAMKRLVFYMNRAGENLENKSVLNQVKTILKKK